MAKLVNKQFNSPIGLYSEQSIRDVIERDSQILANGAVGVNFNNPTVGKPSNLQNSAVLRMLEEEENRQRNGQAPINGYIRPLRENINWPPPEYEHRNHQRATFKDVVTPGLKRVAWPPPNEGENGTEQPPAQPQGGPQFSSHAPPQASQAPPSQARHYQQPLQPLVIANGAPHQPPSSVSPALNASPSGFRPATPSNRWAPVHSPVLPPTAFNQAPNYPNTTNNPPATAAPYPSQQFQAPSAAPNQQYQPLVQPYQAQQYQPVAAPAQPAYQPQPRAVEPPPSLITLRQQAPVSQAPPPVVTSQPATATFKGGKNLRGDMKWPPENVRSQMDEENRQRIELARGPAFRPRLVRKDYGSFFAQHALNSSYPGYKAPPGTQYYDPSQAY